ncbi:glycosyltransferase family 2 protein [bacterium]|nr:glycosyltransferase family 2 protein [bacterium]
MLSALATAIQTVVIWYFVGLNVCYLVLNLLALHKLNRTEQRRDLDELPPLFLGLEPPISILVPAYNEALIITTTVRSLLQLNYSEYEILIVNDGSGDGTLEELTREFALQPFPEAFHDVLKTRPVRGVYHSKTHPKIRVIDKENGGKADALNSGINLARYPLFCVVDADSILQRDSLQRVVQPFIEDPATVAAGGTIRIANGCKVESGFLAKPGLPRNYLARFQVIEYLRAFLFGRLGWASLNALMIVSGAFGLFNKDRVVEAGGYRTDSIGEDMELIVRLHRKLKLAGIPYRITFLPDPLCWTEVPEDLKTLKNQRIRWQRGLGESLLNNRQLLFHPKAGAIGWIAFPFLLFFEWLGPVIELTGAAFMVVGFWQGTISYVALGVYLFVSLGLGILLSVNAILLEEISFHLYPSFLHLLILMGFILAESLGYRQLNLVWRLMGIFQFLVGNRAKWGEMKRRGSWT